MLNSKSTKIIFVLFIVSLIQALFLISTSITETALASGGGSDSGGSGSSGSSDSGSSGSSAPTPAFSGYSTRGGYTDSGASYGGGGSTWSNAVHNAGGGSVTVFSGGNVNVQSSGSDYFARVTGGTRFYSNGDGTYNTVTYRDTGGGSSSDDDNNNGGGGCPSGYTAVSGGCCPNEWVKTTTSGSGKGRSTKRSCNPPSSPATAPTATISQSSSSTEPGESFTVTYGRSGGGVATSCVLEHQEPNSSSYTQIDSNSGNTSTINQSLDTLNAHQYRSRCTGVGGTSDWENISHQVLTAPPTVSLTADDNSIIYGDTTTLRWTVTDANVCSASDGWSGNKSETGGSEDTNPLIADTTFRLSCSGDGGTVQDSTTVQVETGTGAELSNISCASTTRRDSECDLEWDVGTSIPSTCSIKIGSNTIAGYSSLTQSTGILTVTVGGESQYFLDCPSNPADVLIKVLPEFQET